MYADGVYSDFEAQTQMFIVLSGDGDFAAMWTNVPSKVQEQMVEFLRKKPRYGAFGWHKPLEDAVCNASESFVTVRLHAMGVRV